MTSMDPNIILPASTSPAPVQVDPGTEPARTPGGTGRLGNPVGNAVAWGEPGTAPADARKARSDTSFAALSIGQQRAKAGYPVGAFVERAPAGARTP